MKGTSSVTQTVVESKATLTLAVETYEDSFERYMAERDKSPRTMRLYLVGVSDFRAWFERTTGKSLDPALITPLDVKSYRDSYLSDERRLAPSTINSYLSAVRAFCKWARDQGLAATDPSDGIKGIKSVDAAPRWLSRQDQYALLRSAQELVQLGDLRAGDDEDAPARMWSRRDRALVVLMLNAGLRLSEVAALELDDVVINPRSGHVWVRKGKGRKSRKVALNKDARAALQEWLDVRPDAKCRSFFLSQKGWKKLSSRAISRAVQRVGERAGLEVTPHMLRHSLAKNMVDEGISLDRVGHALGHASLDTTKRYTKPSDTDMQVEMEKVAWTG